MPGPYPPVNPKCPHFLHGGDYNPDQWPTEVWAEDMRLMKLSGCNAMSVGIFSWAQLEPQEGRYTFDWLDRIMDMLAENDAWAVLATPSAAQPAWMSARYPEILRTDYNRIHHGHGGRVNYCLTSPVWREKIATIATALAERYKDHPALLMWHVHNEYSGECYCDQCAAAFRDWLGRKYPTLDALNQAYWAAFWSHTYTDWSQVGPPGSPYGEGFHGGLWIDWKRFTTEQTIACFRTEADVLRRLSPGVPVTTNLMGTYPPLDYWKFARELDVISWDSYPRFHERPGESMHGTGFTHDLNRCLGGGKPFLLMESSPSSQNWMPVMRLKRPGMHRVMSLQAVAHGSDSVQYFQWRKGRGGHEKFHGAVVDHEGSENSRVFQDVAEVGQILAQLDPVIGSAVKAEVAIVYDWENGWAIEHSAGPRKDKEYIATLHEHYRTFWEAGVPVDVVGEEGDFSGYKLLIAPMLYMVRPGVAERIEAFVEAGGTFVATYLSGIADENDLVFTGGWPGPLRRLMGIRAEELDVLYDDERNLVVPARDNALGLTGPFEARVFCDLIHAESAEVLASYGEDFYAGRPALTVNRFGQGRAYYVASRNDEAFLDAFYAALMREQAIRPVLSAKLPRGVSVQARSDGQRDYVFMLNFTRQTRHVPLSEPGLENLLTGQAIGRSLDLEPYGSAILTRPAR